MESISSSKDYHLKARKKCNESLPLISPSQQSTAAAIFLFALSGKNMCPIRREKKKAQNLVNLTNTSSQFIKQNSKEKKNVEINQNNTSRAFVLIVKLSSCAHDFPVYSLYFSTSPLKARTCANW